MTSADEHPDGGLAQTAGHSSAPGRGAGRGRTPSGSPLSDGSEVQSPPPCVKGGARQSLRQSRADSVRRLNLLLTPIACSQRKRASPKEEEAGSLRLPASSHDDSVTVTRRRTKARDSCLVGTDDGSTSSRPKQKRPGEHEQAQRVLLAGARGTAAAQAPCLRVVVGHGRLGIALE